MYLKEISFISQSVVSDIQPYKSVPGSNRTEGTSKEALANPDNFQSRPDFPSQRVLKSLYRGSADAETINGNPFVFESIRSSPPVFKCYPYTSYHYSEWVIRHKGPLPAKPNNERNKKNHMDTGVSVKSQLKAQNFSFEWLKQITISNLLNKKIQFTKFTPFTKIHLWISKQFPF